MILKFGRYHQGLKQHKVDINHDLVVTLTYFMPIFLRYPMHLNGENW